MATYLKRAKPRLRVKERYLPKMQGVLGDLLYAVDLPEGHACCPNCKGFKFEVTCYPGGNKIEMGCPECGDRYFIMFPVDVTLPSGKFVCRRHPMKGAIVIKNLDTICVGCESCRSEIQIRIKSDTGLVAG
jgi:hypothetical protein